MYKTESSSYDDFPDNTDVMWMKMALMAASRAEVSEHAEGKPSVGCVIRRSRSRGPPAVLAVGWNGFLPDTLAEEIAAIQGRSFKGPRAAKDRDNALTAELGLHAEVNALQYCSERPEMATIYTTHVPCYKCAKQLVARKVGRVFYLFWMKGCETSIELFKKFDITCVPFGRRDEVLEDFNVPDFLEKRKILEGSTVVQTSINCEQYFLDSKDYMRHLEERVNLEERVKNYEFPPLVPKPSNEAGTAVEGAAEVTESNEADGAGSGHVEGSAEASGDSNKEKRNDHEGPSDDDLELVNERELELTNRETAEEESNNHDNFPGDSDVMWMKMALMAASRAEIPRETVDMPSVGCVIRRSRTRGSPAVLAVGWNGFLPNTPEEELKEIKGRSFKGKNADQKRDNVLTADLGLHAETNALQYCSENPEMATVYVTHMPCYDCAKQLVAHKVGRVFYLYCTTYSEGDHEPSTIRLFKKFNISCIAFSKRDKVLEDFSKSFPEDRGILRGNTDAKTPPESCPSFLDSRDSKSLPASQTLYTHVQTSALTGCKEKLWKSF